MDREKVASRAAWGRGGWRGGSQGKPAGDVPIQAGPGSSPLPKAAGARFLTKLCLLHRHFSSCSPSIRKADTSFLLIT